MTEEEDVETEVRRRMAAMREEELVDLLCETLVRLDVIADRLEKTLHRQQQQYGGERHA